MTNILLKKKINNRKIKGGNKMKIWFRVGMESDITDEEMNVLLVYSGQKEGERDVRKAHSIMEKIINRGELSGETYIVGKSNGGVDNYNNPEEEINFLF